MDPEQPERPLVAIVGPTATGKTSAAVQVARAVHGEIVSADSVAVYRGIDIGAAKPTPDERQTARFHLIDVAEPDEPFTVARFKAMAQSCVAEIESSGHRPLIVGGTGLYVRVLLEDYGLTETPPDPVLRAKLDGEADDQGAPVLHERLVELDPDAAARIHPNDRVRIVRALEVVLRTGVPISAKQAEDAVSRRTRPSIRIGLTASRDELYRRIDVRVEQMIRSGLKEEVSALLARGYDPALTPLRSLGYKEMIAHLSGELSLAESVAAIKMNTRRFAKRQLTWFRAEPNVQWIDVCGKSDEEVASEILLRMRDR